MAKRQYKTRAAEFALAAIALGQLERHGGQWRARRGRRIRVFRSITIDALLATGAIVRDGDRLRRADIQTA